VDIEVVHIKRVKLECVGHWDHLHHGYVVHTKREVMGLELSQHSTKQQSHALGQDWPMTTPYALVSRAVHMLQNPHKRDINNCDCEGPHGHYLPCRSEHPASEPLLSKLQHRIKTSGWAGLHNRY